MKIGDSGIGVGGPGGRAVCCLFAALLLLATGAVRGDQEAWVELVSHTHSFLFGAGNEPSYPVAISADGRYVVFYSWATNLIAGGSDTNGKADAFVWDGDTKTVTLISHRAGNAKIAGNGASLPVAMSSDGRYVAFMSDATDLIGGGSDTNGGADAFLWDRVTGGVRLISHTWNSETTAANGISLPTAMTDDGSVVTFASTATNLENGLIDTNGKADAFVWLRGNGMNIAVSLVDAPEHMTGNNKSWPVAISPDGRYVLLMSEATDFALVDTNGVEDVFVCDRNTGLLRLISHIPTPSGTTGNGRSIPVAMSDDGRKVLFNSLATNLVAGGVDTNGKSDAFLWWDSGEFKEVILVSHKATAGKTAGNGESLAVALSGSEDGWHVAFESTATDLIAGGVDTNYAKDAFLWDSYPLGPGDVQLISHADGEPLTAGNGASRPVAMRSDGGYVVLESLATDLISGGVDVNHSEDAFLWERGTGGIRLISHVQQSPLVTGNGQSTPVAISRHGLRIAYRSNSTNLFPAFPMNGKEQAFRYEIGLLSDGFESGRFWAWSGVFGGG
ncbi:MAG TPA: hypothetical protein PLS95_19365 [Thermoanaerobaculales bacterium]|jgi:hypothetical protein|nr:hypothetical protein [Thermoanaerobaculales bacterium]